MDDIIVSKSQVLSAIACNKARLKDIGKELKISAHVIDRLGWRVSNLGKTLAAFSTMTKAIAKDISRYDNHIVGFDIDREIFILDLRHKGNDINWITYFNVSQGYKAKLKVDFVVKFKRKD